MNNLQTASTQRTIWVRWTARAASIFVCAWFTFILTLVATNEDPPRPEVIPALILIALTIVACVAAWRWERAGGIATMVGAMAIGIALWLPPSLAGLNFVMPIAILTYVVPFGTVGALFVWAGWMARPKIGERTEAD